jgi:branched-chain amino acid transport system permease protein
LNLLAEGTVPRPTDRETPIVLTPHDREFARLAGEEPGADRVAAALRLAATVGAVAGLMVAPMVFLDPNMMAGILIYAFASATLGGFTSPGGAVVGGLLVGVIENLVGTYVAFIGTELKLTIALAIILVVLVIKPSGLFGRAVVHRV